jgi:hypothetical protein
MNHPDGLSVIADSVLLPLLPPPFGGRTPVE